MGLFHRIFGNVSNSEEPSKAMTVYAPLTGKVIPLKEIPDQVFSQGILGPGCGIDPVSETVTAPFDGEITIVADTKHSVGMTSTDGLELLIHVGMDTVDMNGKGFHMYVKVGQRVKKGERLFDFSLKEIRAAGHSPVTAVVLCSGCDGMVLEQTYSEIRSGDVLIRAD